MTDAQRIARLEPPCRPVRMVLDTDAFNEVDDQFAIGYAVRAAEAGDLRLEAIYAAPFSHPGQLDPGDGMENSFREIHHILDLLDCPPERECFVFRGAARYTHGRSAASPAEWTALADGAGQEDGPVPVDSPAVSDLIGRAMASPDDDPLYVVGIGACTNIASALLLKPEVADHVVVVWSGGNGESWPTGAEYNLRQDLPAARVLFDSGVPLIQFPARPAVAGLVTSLPELEHHLRGKSVIGSYLCDIVRRYAGDRPGAWSKVIWDIAPIAYLLNPDNAPSVLQSSPIIGPDLHLSVDRRRPLIRVIREVRRDEIFTDCFARLSR